MTKIHTFTLVRAPRASSTEIINFTHDFNHKVCIINFRDLWVQPRTTRTSSASSQMSLSLLACTIVFRPSRNSRSALEITSLSNATVGHLGKRTAQSRGTAEHSTATAAAAAAATAANSGSGAAKVKESNFKEGRQRRAVCDRGFHGVFARCRRHRLPTPHAGVGGKQTSRFNQRRVLGTCEQRPRAWKLQPYG